jgi:hypothetical protein
MVGRFALAIVVVFVSGFLFSLKLKKNAGEDEDPDHSPSFVENTLEIRVIVFSFFIGLLRLIFFHIICSRFTDPSVDRAVNESSDELCLLVGDERVHE